jgi:hypothetical protein
MREEVEAVLVELEGIKLSEKTSLLYGSEVIKNLWEELSTYETQLKAFLKAGEFGGLAEEEIPYLIDRIGLKKSDLISLISIEKNRVALKAKEVKSFREQAGRQVQHQRRVQVAAAPEPGVIDEISEWIDFNREPIESFIAISVIVVVIQFCLNIYFVNQTKIRTQVSVIEPLEQRLSLETKKTAELENKVSSLQKEIAFYRSLNIPLGDGIHRSKNKTSYRLVKRNRIPASVNSILSR